MATPRRIRKRVRNVDPVTSRQGAWAVDGRAPNQSLRLLLTYAHALRGQTDDEAAETAGLLDSCYWKRCGELREAKWIVPVRLGTHLLTRKGRAGSARMVCKITASGRQHLSAKGLL